jgi:hypothetical protein
LAGVQVRGKNAAILQLIFMAFSLLATVFKLLWHLGFAALWLVFLTIKWVVDFVIGFYRGYRSGS